MTLTSASKVITILTASLVFSSNYGYNFQCGPSYHPFPFPTPALGFQPVLPSPHRLHEMRYPMNEKRKRTRRFPIYTRSFVSLSSTTKLCETVDPTPPHHRHSSSFSTTTTVSPSDQETILSQLGYLPTNLLSISARRGGGIGTPLVLKTYPLNGGADRRKTKARGQWTPFPTLYWFSCPVVGRAVAELERRGLVGELEQRLRGTSGIDGSGGRGDDSDDDNDDGGLSVLERFIRSHEEYARERWETLSEHHRYVLEHNLQGTNDRMRDMVRYSGIAGTDYRSFAISLDGHDDDTDGLETKGSSQPSIKCLHAHYAHYRAQIARCEEEGVVRDDDAINIVGEWTHFALQEEFPELVL